MIRLQAERVGVTGGRLKSRDVGVRRGLDSRHLGLVGPALMALQGFQHLLQGLMLPCR